MDQIFIQKIYIYLQKQNPTDDEIIEAATLLLRIAPNRHRALFNSATKRPKKFEPYIRRELQKHYDIRQRGLDTNDVEAYNAETIKVVTEDLQQKPEDVEISEDEDQSSIAVLGVRGKREDHDSLPDSIKAIWNRNIERWKKMRELHIQLSVMIANPDYQPCDGNELCYQLRQADTDLRNDYAIYDGYQSDTSSETAKQPEDSTKTITDNVKVIQKARAAITRNLKYENPTDKQLQNLQDAVNALVALKQEFKPETIERLKAAGISIPTI